VKRPQLVRLHDILEAIDGVAEMLGEVGFDACRRDLKLKRAIERSVEIVSEASRHIPESWKSGYPDQPWPEIAAIGNLLRHHYQRVDDMVMWKIATRSLPKLRPSILAMIRNAET
jgi:uncharacterized protein with HEPN domain